MPQLDRLGTCQPGVCNPGVRGGNAATAQGIQYSGQQSYLRVNNRLGTLRAVALGPVVGDRDGAPARLDWGRAQRAQAAHRRRVRLGLGVREVDSPVDHGTEQTRAKLRTDVIGKLHGGGHLRDEHVAAAEEINRLVLAFMRGLFPSSRPLDGTRGGGGGKRGARRFLDPADRLSLWEARKWSECYAPWSREMGEQWLSCRRGRLNRLGLVWAVVLDNMGPRQLEATHGMRHGTARKVLAEALWRYAEISGIYRGR